MKKFAILLISLCLIISSCADKKADKNKDSTIQKTNLDSTTPIQTKPAKDKKEVTDVYFKANGTEPFWSLTISERMIKLKTIGDSILTPHTIPDRAQDANIKLYRLHTEMAKLNIQINHSECVQVSSGMTMPYSVTVDYMKGRATEFTKLEGCGKYNTDYRLHDIWVLETLNGHPVSNAQFANKLPSIEINSSNNSFTGYAGCNNMNGKLFFEHGILRFTDIASTKKMCPNNTETEFLNALKAVTKYKLENNRLWLSNPSKELLVFKKVD
ncbi:META domain-containing protein [Hanstruepera marina]|uniref:META domain-containing protein n=1 Tax=Hanstruepera marina TaxID=2873265 RepID=UPI001CA62CBA|nr:META domain-containing protein [Hanstruepera marina]